MSHVEDVARINDINERLKSGFIGAVEFVELTRELETKTRNIMPDLLAVAGQFRAGDAEGLDIFIKWLQAMQQNGDVVIHPNHMQRLVRMRAAARLMEGETSDVADVNEYICGVCGKTVKYDHSGV